MSRLLILNDQHLGRVLAVFADHYNGHRPHRALDLTPPSPMRARRLRATDSFGDVLSLDSATRLGNASLCRTGPVLSGNGTVTCQGRSVAGRASHATRIP